jgi:hypothetical protein
MRQCVRCGKPCQTTFCNDCRAFLRKGLQQGSTAYRSVEAVRVNPSPLINQDVSTYTTAPQPIIGDPVTPLPLSSDQYETLVEQPALPGEYDPVTPLPPISSGLYMTQAEQALQNLQDAARRIEAVEQKERHGPRASRLSPLRDISADIQRECTPSPGTWSQSRANKIEAVEEIEDLGDVPDLWSWLARVDSDEDEEIEDEEAQEKGNGESNIDPLLSRHFPSAAESARIEEEDLRRAVADGLATTAQIEVFKRIQARRRLHVLIVCLSVVAILALAIDSFLVSFVFLRESHTSPATVHTPPTFTLSSTVVTYGQTVTLYLRSFPPLSNVYLTHDVNEPIAVKHGQDILQIGADGSAKTTITIGTSWEAGLHTLQAEDVKTRYTASVILHINEGSARSAHLTLSTTSLDFGAATQGSNTVQSLTLHNAGSGAISWMASSNQPWLQITPTEGTFSDSQTVMVGGQRTNLQPGNYKGTITITSNGEAPIAVAVQMTVRPLPADVGAVLAPAPAVLSYRAVDGGVDPSAQPLTINNVGKLPLYWSVASSTGVAPSTNMIMGAFAGSNPNWLAADQASGVVPPGQRATIQVQAHSGNLLPGTYLSTLVLTTRRGYNAAYNTPQSISVSLTVQQHCGLLLNTGNLTFTAVAGQGNPGNQTLGLAASTGCPGRINWSVISSANWVTMAPASGQLKGTSTASISVGINTSNLSKPGVYTAQLAVMSGQSTQSVEVQLTLQKQAMPGAPIISAGPLNLSFAANQGQTNLPGQMVTIANTGHSPLQWSATANAQANPWLTITPTSGTIAPGQTGQMAVDVNAAAVAPGNYMAQIQLNGTDATHALASGSPQTVVVNFRVSAPCVLAKPSSSSLAFSAMQGGNDPAPQTLSITASGNCNWPLSWSTKGMPSWLNVSPSTGQLTANNPTATITIAPSIANLSASQTAQVSLAATDSTGEQVQGSSQSFGVSLTLQQPCSVQISPGNLAFTAIQDQATLTIQASNTCMSINSKATADDGGKGWLNIDTSHSGNGSIIVKVDGSHLSVGTYSGSISVTTTDSSGNPVQGGTQKIPVTLQVLASTYTVSGTVMACADSACSSSQPLSAATITLTDSTGQQVASITADSYGNFSLSNVAPGSYTMTVSGTDSSNVSYSGKQTIAVSGAQQMTIQAFSSSSATPISS